MHQRLSGRFYRPAKYRPEYAYRLSGRTDIRDDI